MITFEKDRDKGDNFFGNFDCEKNRGRFRKLQIVGEEAGARAGARI